MRETNKKRKEVGNRHKRTINPIRPKQRQTKEDQRKHMMTKEATSGGIAQKHLCLLFLTFIKFKSVLQACLALGTGVTRMTPVPNPQIPNDFRCQAWPCFWDSNWNNFGPSLDALSNNIS